ADVAHGRIALLVAAGTDARTAVRNDREIDICLLGPCLGRLENLVLPCRGRPLGVEGGEHVAVDATEVCPVRDKTESDELRVRPGIAGEGVGHHSSFQLFETRKCSENLVRAWRSART